MFIVFGEKQARRRLGFVAEHCSGCSSIRPVKIVRVGMAPHIFWVPLGKGRLIGYYGECDQCGADFDIDPADYASLAKKNVDSLAELQAMTNPRLDPSNRSAVESFERSKRIRAPLLRADHELRQRYAGGTRFDRTTGLALLATIAIPLIMFAADLSFLSHPVQEAIGIAALWFFILGLIATFVLMAKEPRRFFRRELEPELVTELRSVNPRTDELEESLKLLKKYEYRVAKHVSSARLLEQIQVQTLSYQSV